MLVVSAPKDTVKHYGYAYLSDVQNIYTESYHEYGTVGRLKVAKGHAVVEDSGVVFCAMDLDGSATNATIDVDGKVYEEKTQGENNVNSAVTQQTTGVFDAAYKDCGYDHHNYEKLVVDDLHIYYVCTACGYTVIAAGTNSTTGEIIYHTSTNTDATASDPVVTVNETTGTITVNIVNATVPVSAGEVDGSIDVEKVNSCTHEHLTYVQNDDKTTHTGTCDICGLKVTGNHDKLGTSGACSKCGYKDAEVMLTGGDKTLSFAKLTDFRDYVNGTGTGDSATAHTCENQTATLLSNVTLTEDWVPFESFAGTFDGNNKTISGMSFTISTEVAGFFKEVGDANTTTTIKNLTLESYTLNVYKYSGVLIGRVNYDTTISNVTIGTGTLTASGNNNAGLVGKVNTVNEKTALTITDCTISATVHGTGSSCYAIAGVIGASSDTCAQVYFIKNTTFNGKVISDRSTDVDSSGNGAVSGFVGSMMMSENKGPGAGIYFSNCHMNGELTISSCSSSNKSAAYIAYISETGNASWNNCYVKTTKVSVSSDNQLTANVVAGANKGYGSTTGQPTYIVDNIQYQKTAGLSNEMHSTNSIKISEENNLITYTVPASKTYDLYLNSYDTWDLTNGKYVGETGALIVIHNTDWYDRTTTITGTNNNFYNADGTTQFTTFDFTGNKYNATYTFKWNDTAWIFDSCSK